MHESFTNVRGPSALLDRVRAFLDAHGAAIQASRPHQCRRHVQVRVRGIDREIRAVDVVAVEFVDDPDSPVVTSDIPLVRVRPRHRERLALAIEGLQLEHVLRVFVQRIPSR